MLPILVNYCTVIALISKNEKCYSKKMSFGGCNDEISASSTKVQKGNKANYFFYSNTVKCSAELTRYKKYPIYLRI